MEYSLVRMLLEQGLVGQIIETNSLTSKVILITEPSHDTPGEINRTGEKIVLAVLHKIKNW